MAIGIRELGAGSWELTRRAVEHRLAHRRASQPRLKCLRYQLYSWWFCGSASSPRSRWCPFLRDAQGDYQDSTGAHSSPQKIIIAPHSPILQPSGTVWGALTLVKYPITKKRSSIIKLSCKYVLSESVEYLGYKVGTRIRFPKTLFVGEFSSYVLDVADHV